MRIATTRSSNIDASSNSHTARRADIGRSRLSVGEVGKIDLKQIESCGDEA